MNNPARHHEIENKFAADTLSVDAFDRWIDTYSPHRKKEIGGRDTYYERDGYVVRHRYPQFGGPGELTVKLRTSETSIEDRKEIDLPVAEWATQEDASAFLKAIGFKPVFTLYKYNHIYWLARPNMTDKGMHEATFALYDVQEVGTDTPARRFLEVEIEKESGLTRIEACAELAGWRERLQGCFRLGAPLNESLYEIYSGNRYRMVQA